MESQTNIILQQSGDVLNEQKLLHTKLQEHSQELIQEYNRLHSEMQEKMKNGLSGALHKRDLKLLIHITRFGLAIRK